MDAIHKQEFRVRDLPTRSVTLFPTRAQVIRDIKEVSLKPGSNQITVVGFTPTVDESSIKVEGTGSAIISDITVELLPNREIFLDVYPEMDQEDESDDDDDTDDDIDMLDDPPELKEAHRKLMALRDEELVAKELVSSAESRLKYLDAYGKMLDRKKGVEIDVGIENYRAERARVFADHLQGSQKCRELAEPIQKLVREEARLQKRQLRAQLKATRAMERVHKVRAKDRAKKARRKAEQRKEKERVLRELESFWPRKCYSVRIMLDVPNFTPSSSRRSSVASFTEVAQPAKEDNNDEEATLPTCDLAISYVTSSAFWSPSYDLKLSTTNNTGSLCFDAKLTNITSESWKSCKVILSTSQTAFSGLSDTIPALIPWHVKLAKGQGMDGIFNSREEVAQKSKWVAQSTANLMQRPRYELFGMPASESAATQQVQRLQQAALVTEQLQKRAKMMQMAQQMPQQMPQQMLQQTGPQGLFGAVSNTGSSGGNGFGGVGAVPVAPPIPVRAPAPASIPRMRLASKAARRVVPGRSQGELEEDSNGEDDDGTMAAGDVAEIEFQESSFEETGMTTTYDLPGLKSLTPSSTASKQRVARVSFQNVVFSHTIVAKYKPAAYLKARLKNASKITLLKGAAGLTLDGSFMGKTTLPHCSAGDVFTLSLGVDPAIRVVYPKPDVKRATTGLFSKEDSSAYVRSVTVSNTRASAGKPVSLLVLDQVPVSEDEKLRVEIAQPRGLLEGGAPVAAGVGMTTAGAGGTPTLSKEWGTATAQLKKAGEITWNVQLNAGRSVKLALEYDISVPSGEGVVQC